MQDRKRVHAHRFNMSGSPDEGPINASLWPLGQASPETPRCDFADDAPSCRPRHGHARLCRDVWFGGTDTQTTAHRRLRNGFTLIELIIVTLIVGIMAAVIAPSYRDSLAHFRAEAAAQRIVSDLRYARRLAKTSAGEQSVEFAPDQNQYELPGVGHPDRPLDRYRVELSKTGYPASLASVDFDGNVDVTFDMYGQPFSGSPLAPLTAGTVVVQSGMEQRAVVVNPTTGKASIQ